MGTSADQVGTKREQALRWRAVERERRGRGWSRARAMAEVARLKRLERGLLARLWDRIRG
jgi:hypothetical protein